MLRFRQFFSEIFKAEIKFKCEQSGIFVRLKYQPNLKLT